jgi:hypothetical protein
MPGWQRAEGPVTFALEHTDAKAAIRLAPSLCLEPLEVGYGALQ